jgi:2-iminobutanoate/2-iminopropanoate deaminase
MTKKTVSVDGAPRPFQGAPYSQAVAAGGFLYVSGQVGLDPGSGELVAGGIEEQTRRALDNLRAILEGAGSGLDGVVKTTVYMTDLGQFSAMNEVYGGYFGADPPARATVQVAALPAGAVVEIEAVALA